MANRREPNASFHIVFLPVAPGGDEEIHVGHGGGVADKDGGEHVHGQEVEILEGGDLDGLPFPHGVLHDAHGGVFLPVGQDGPNLVCSLPSQETPYQSQDFVCNCRNVFLYLYHRRS